MGSLTFIENILPIGKARQAISIVRIGQHPVNTDCDLFHRTKNGAKLSPLGVAVRPYLDQIDECAEGARRQVAYISTVELVSIPRAKFMRKIFYGTAISASVLFIGVLFGHQPNSETATRSKAKTTVDVAALEATIDIKHLPRQIVPSEVYQ